MSKFGKKEYLRLTNHELGGIIFVVKFRVGFRALSADGTGSCPSDENRVLRSEIRIPLVHKELSPPCAARSIREVFILKKTEKKKGLHSAIVITCSGLLTAASVVLAALAKYFFGEGALRFTIECLPIFIGAFAFGPFVGAAIAVGADLISCVIAGMAPNPLIAAGSFFVGLIAGTSYKFFFRKHPRIRVMLAVFTGHMIGSMLIKSLALHIYYNMGPIVFLRIPIYIGTAIIECIILSVLFKSKAVTDQLDKVKEIK